MTDPPMPPTDSTSGNTTLQSRRRVLFVDDDSAFLEMIERVMSALSHGAWEIFTAESASSAMARLQEQTVNLVVIDVQMPVVDGLQFLTLVNRRYPHLPKVVMTGFATEAYRVACLSNGAELFLEKPKTQEDQAALFSALNELMRFQPEEGFRGILRRVGLPDVIQMECLSASSSVLEISGGQMRGHIYIESGAIVHAESGSQQGEQALNHLLGLRGGEFRLVAFREPPARTIEGSWEFLLMEAARSRDEALEAEEGGEGGTEAPTMLPSLVDAESEAPETGGVRRTIEEVLVCAEDGSVLHEWQVRNVDLWINFFEFLSQKARGLGQRLGLGELERLEAGMGDSRLIALLGQGRGVLVRCREEGS